MKPLLPLLLICCLFTGTVTAQTVMYVAHGPGLSIREKPDVKAKVLGKIPYGTKMTLGSSEEDTTRLVTEGFNTLFHKITYNKTTGYIIGAYLLPMPPPKAGIKTLTEYLAQLAPKNGPAVEIKKGTMNNITETGYTLKKQLYKNGAEHHQFTGYEYGSDTWMLPELNVQQAWVLLRLIPEFKQTAAVVADEFPVTTKKTVKNNIEYDIKVEREGWEGPFAPRKLKIEYADGAYYFVEIFLLENQVVIFAGSGV
jgi:Bacterial SH3 domain